MARKNVYPREVEQATLADRRSYFVELEVGASIQTVQARDVLNVGDRVIVYPFDREGRPKYSKILSIEFEGLKGRMPVGFLKNWSFGYGFTRYLSPLVKVLEEVLGATHVVVSKAQPSSQTGTVVTLNAKDLSGMFVQFSAIAREHREADTHTANSAMNALFPTQVSAPALKYPKGGLSAYINRWSVKGSTLSPADMSSLTSLIAVNKAGIDISQVLASKQLIEEIYIEDVIKEFEVVLKRAGKGKIEEEWQTFFKKYNWIFSQLFASPVMIFQDKAFVGGKTYQDKDGKIADFLYTNSLTKSISIIEIKTHKTKLMQASAYRGSDVFASHEELAGAINQVLNQRENLQKHYLSLGLSEVADIQNTRCVVLAGQLRSLSPEQTRAFELFRSNSKDVAIYTFDELLERVRGLKNIISGQSGKPKKQSTKASLGSALVKAGATKVAKQKSSS